VPAPRSTNWELIYAIALEKGAKFPELLAAQWALESSFGQHLAAKHNYFGIKAGAGDSASEKMTNEVVNGKTIRIKARFKNFESPTACVDYLVNKWYKDYKSYRGVNNAHTREEAAQMLVDQGYATDPAYAEKLIKLMREYDLKPKDADVVKPLPPVTALEKPKAAKSLPPLFELEATLDTWLKKEPIQAIDLPEGSKVEVKPGKRYGVAVLEELPADSHARVTLAGGAGRWYLWMPHWKRVGSASGGAPVQQPATPRTVDWTNFSSQVTPHLTVGEVLQWDARRRPQPGSGAELRILATARQFEALRVAWGRPLSVTSFYRPEPINSQVGGVPGSRHVSGEAFDIYPATGSLDAFYEWVKRRWTGGLGDGRRRGFLHLDTRNGGHFVPGAGVRPYVEFGY
jgi:hypothetical protein